MQKRYMPFLLRQIGLLCRRNPREYLLVPGDSGKLNLPLVQVSKDASFEDEIRSYFKTGQLNCEVKGIVQVQIGNNKVSSFYRWIYFFSVNGNQELRPDLGSFYRLEGDTENQIQSQVKELINKIEAGKRVWNRALFRQNFKELAPREKDLKIEVDI